MDEYGYPDFLQEIIELCDDFFEDFEPTFLTEEEYEKSIDDEIERLRNA